VPAATGYVEHIIVRHRLQQTYHLFKVVAAGKAFVMDVAIGCAAELFPDSVLEFTSH
jgi:hypothetical protein